MQGKETKAGVKETGFNALKLFHCPCSVTSHDSSASTKLLQQTE